VLPGDTASTVVPENQCYLNPEQAEKILVDVWGNPPGTPTWGMIMTAETDPSSPESWGTVIAFEPGGYIDDRTAEALNANTLLARLRQQAALENRRRVVAGFPGIAVIDWAVKPFFDRQRFHLHYATILDYGDAREPLLNYTVLGLGRTGWLIFNAVAALRQRETVTITLNSIAAATRFHPGYRYEDFDPGTDSCATLDLAGIIAANDSRRITDGLARWEAVFGASWQLAAMIWAPSKTGLGMILKKFRRKPPQNDQ